MSPTPRYARPTALEHPPGYAAYFAAIAGDDAGPELPGQVEAATRCLAALSDGQALRRDAPGKWSVKQVIGHVADNERVFAYRALRFARGVEVSVRALVWVTAAHARHHLDVLRDRYGIR